MTQNYNYISKNNLENILKRLDLVSGEEYPININQLLKLQSYSDYESLPCKKIGNRKEENFDMTIWEDEGIPYVTESVIVVEDKTEPTFGNWSRFEVIEEDYTYSIKIKSGEKYMLGYYIIKNVA